MPRRSFITGPTRVIVQPPAVGGAAALYVTGPNDTGFYNAPGYPGGTSDHAGSSLIDGTATTIQSDTTYNYYRNLGSAGDWGAIGTTGTPVHNVTFHGCEWSNNGYNTANVVLRTDGPVTFNWCTVRPYNFSDNTASVGQLAGFQYGIVADGTAAIPGTYNSFQGGPVTFSHCDFWGFANATKMGSSTLANPLTFDSCWVHNSRTNDDTLDHTDGIGLPAGGTASYVTINKCRIEDDGDTNGVCYQNTPGPSTWDHFTITNNLLGGWGFTVNVSGGTAGSPNGGTNITFTDNTFSTRLRPIYGPLYDNLVATGSGNLWRRNKWLVPAGAAWGNPAHDGWYWMPISTNIPVGDSDTAFVSLTDFTG